MKRFFCARHMVPPSSPFVVAAAHARRATSSPKRLTSRWTSNLKHHFSQLAYLGCLAIVMLISSGCEQSTRITAFDELSQFSLSTATITPTGIIAGSIDNGAAAHFNSTTEANFFWRTGGVNDSQQPVSAVALSADNNTAITASGSTLNLWDTQSGQSRHYLSAPATINAVAINPSGTRAALALDNKTAVVINLERGGIVQTWVHASPVLSVAINNKGVVLTGEEANAAHLWRLGVDEALVTQTHEDAVTLVAFDDSGDTAVTASRYDSVHFWQTAGKHETQYRISGKAMALKAGRRAVDIAFTAPNSVLVAFSDNTIEYRRFTQQTPIQRWALGKKTMLARENSTLIAIGQFKNSWRALMSDGRLYELGAL